MSDPTAAAWAGQVGNGRPAPGPLTPDRVDAVIADFRGWLTELLVPPPAAAGPPPAAVDLASVVAQVTALRHEVNLQTKASRAAVEQTAEAMKLISAPPTADIDEAVRPLVKALIDIADALAVSAKQVERARIAAEDAITAPAESAAPKPGFFARLFLPPAPAAQTHTETFGFLRDVLTGVGDGYALSLRRVERALPQFGLEPVECVGRSFDPELMEAVEATDGGGRPSGTVLAEVRRGYRWHGKTFRFAQVTVAR